MDRYYKWRWGAILALVGILAAIGLAIAQMPEYAQVAGLVGVTFGILSIHEQ